MSTYTSPSRSNPTSRRDFLKRSATTVAGTALAFNLDVARNAHAAGNDTIKIALVGCGGRGTGAAVNALSTKANVKLVAMADAFKDSLEGSLRSIHRECRGPRRRAKGTAIHGPGRLSESHR